MEKLKIRIEASASEQGELYVDVYAGAYDDLYKEIEDLALCIGAAINSVACRLGSAGSLGFPEALSSVMLLSNAAAEKISRRENVFVDAENLFGEMECQQ